MTQVLITGAGAVSCLGVGVPAMWRALCAAPDGLPERADDPGARMPLPLIHMAPSGPGPGRATRLALTAAREAVADSGLDPRLLARSPVVIGTGGGNADHWERPLDPARPYTPAFTVAAAIGAEVGSSGAATSVSNACSAGGFALAMAADMIRAGEADVVLAGGAEAYSRVALGCFNRMGAVDPYACRPFHRDRGGTVFGEGAAVLVLESAGHARARGAAHHYAALAGSGWSCDAHHLTAPDPDGVQIRRAMTDALDDAGAAPGSVGCVVPHGTGTRLNDEVESRALGSVFGDLADCPPLYSLKALIGHTAGAAGALGAVAGALILDHGTVPPNLALGADRDPGCPVNLPEGGEEPLDGRHVMVNAFAFGGNNVSLVLEGRAA
ncbi:beta-ketoacyl-[acyl-carrier-protein] synthase family protein [Streptomyces albireticuli]|uniref:3-oxoacyl-ACP synthase n=1 Tax=Streptomyces albireticuli TaxID=1940 RepID=A0A2A2DAA8_9ACTN|nr:beta-ketoacyl-[acyl-carrier-protein] synthase family protein [Streptomyces albireticuli]MCD9140969.1 beta-ketoacyl-[acyl-carrier-protein] synthase family protein [Streptomyces albireticuli]MCD9161069.1 beta-ketoacyl-[acyl-carrier-protein] synthase family protein [Streptomyces albireticuli]MCD9190873.1 beta-ketoacyl-[acyl-carrier-protein] synthase family protein [Streptomyces albireticuli]PAU48300.1 3-oxoacyl-ACP synthase [Streptomyces albireticuli]